MTAIQAKTLPIHRFENIFSRKLFSESFIDPVVLGSKVLFKEVNINGELTGRSLCAKVTDTYFTGLYTTWFKPVHNNE